MPFLAGNVIVINKDSLADLAFKHGVMGVDVMEFRMSIVLRQVDLSYWTQKMQLVIAHDTVCDESDEEKRDGSDYFESDSSESDSSESDSSESDSVFKPPLKKRRVTGM